LAENDNDKNNFLLLTPTPKSWMQCTVSTGDILIPLSFNLNSWIRISCPC
jgi:hypothetical protein